MLTKSTDTLRAQHTEELTAALAHEQGRTTARVKELDLKLADLLQENARLLRRQLSDDPEIVVMRLFRDLQPRKKARTLGVLYAESGKLLMRTAGGDELLPVADQAGALNHLILTHTDEERAAVLTSLIGIGQVSQQFALLRKLLAHLADANQ